MRNLSPALVLILFLFLGACGTTDSQLASEGRSEAYVTGFHDGRHSGIKEAGNAFEHFIKDSARFENDPEYRAGWLAGENEGKRLQAQASGAGAALGGAYQAHEIDREIDRETDMDAVARDAVKDLDTSGLEVLEDH